MAESDGSSIRERQCIEGMACISSYDCLHKNNDLSLNASTAGTINGAAMSNERLKSFPDILDAFQEGELPPEHIKVLFTIISSIQNLHDRLTTLEMQDSKRALSANRIDWKERLELAEFRITENGGRINQRDLQRKLGIKSRTTMTFLVKQLRNTRRYNVSRIGRCNLIEGIE